MTATRHDARVREEFTISDSRRMDALGIAMRASAGRRMEARA